VRPARDIDRQVTVLSLLDIFRTLKHSARLLFAALIAGAIAGLFVSVMLPKTYTAEGVMVVEPPSNPGATVSPESHLATALDVMQSRAFLESALEQIALPPDLDESGGGWRSFFGDESPTPETLEKRQSSLISRVRSGLEVSTEKNSFAVTVEFTSSTPRFSADYANALMNGYIREQQKRMREVKAERVDALTRQLAEVQLRINAGESLIADLTSTPNAQATIQQRRGEIAGLQTIYNQMRLELETAVSQPVQADARVVSPARLPTDSSSPSAKILIAAFGMLTLVLMALYILSSRQLRNDAPV
jgi:uncharacterized protein involved in exopolysaccharide biosynthesis